MNTNIKCDIKNHTSFNSSYRRTNIPTFKKSVHCIDALEDIINTLLNKHYTKMEYYHTESVVIVKLDNVSHRFITPMSSDDITHFISKIPATKKLDKDKLLECIMISTNLENIVKTHCLNCYKLSKCKAYSKYITL